MDLEWLWLIIPLSYFLISTFFFCFPTILHKKYRYKYEPFNDLLQSNEIFCIGHRGGGFQGPQNTIEVFEKTYKRVDMFQMDTQLTKDKRLVVHHDGVVNRTCGRDIQISQCNYDDLPCFKQQIQSFGGGIVKTSKNKIPLLQEVFQKFPDKPINIQLKYPSQEGVLEFSRIIRKFGRENITIWGAANNQMNARLRQNSPQTVNFYSGAEVLRIYILFLLGLLPFVCIRQGVMDIPLATNDFKRIAMNFTTSNCGKCIIFLAFGILKCFNCLSWFWIRHLKKRGILTFYFILNSEQDYESAISKGCSGIMTDQTQDLKNYLIREGLQYGAHQKYPHK